MTLTHSFIGSIFFAQSYRRENAVTSCLKCNGRKGSMLVRDLKAIGMKLHTEPKAPTRHELATKAGKMLPRKVHSTWQPYLGFATTSDANTPTPDLEALGVYDDEDQSRTPAATKTRKKTSKNQKKRAKKKAQTADQEVFLRR